MAQIHDAIAYYHDLCTQDELAHRAGCAAETVRKLEAGSRRASKAVAQQLADALQLAGSERTDFLRLARQSPTLETPTPTATKPAPAQTGEAAPLLATKLYLPRPRTTWSRARSLFRQRPPATDPGARRAPDSTNHWPW